MATVIFTTDWVHFSMSATERDAGTEAGRKVGTQAAQCFVACSLEEGRKNDANLGGQETFQSARIHSGVLPCGPVAPSLFCAYLMKLHYFFLSHGLLHQYLKINTAFTADFASSPLKFFQIPSCTITTIPYSSLDQPHTNATLSPLLPLVP